MISHYSSAGIVYKAQSRWKFCLSTMLVIITLLLFIFYFNFLEFFQCKTTTIHRAIYRRSKVISPSLCVLTRIYGPQIEYFPVFALSLRHGGFDDIRIYVVNTDARTDVQHLLRAIHSINDLVPGKDFITLLDLGPLPKVNQFGYGVTDQALRYLYAQHDANASMCHYLMVTNGDNLYTKNFGKQILPHMKAGKDLIAWGFVSHHYKEHLKEMIDAKNNHVPNIIDDGTEKCTSVALRIGEIDLGATAYRFVFLHQHKLYYRVDNRPYAMGSDGQFVDQAVKLMNTSTVLRHTLFIHQ